jgi:hypothetical protein
MRITTNILNPGMAFPNPSSLVCVPHGGRELGHSDCSNPSGAALPAFVRYGNAERRPPHADCRDEEQQYGMRRDIWYARRKPVHGAANSLALPPRAKIWKNAHRQQEQMRSQFDVCLTLRPERLYVKPPHPAAIRCYSNLAGALPLLAHNLMLGAGSGYQGRCQMSVYTVHERAMPSLIPGKRAEDLVFVKEGFSWLAFFIGGFWLLLRGLWLEFLIFMALAVVTGTILLGIGLPAEHVQTLLMFFNIVLGFHFYDLQRWKLERRDFKIAGVVTGAGLHECEQRFYARWLPLIQTEREMHTSARPAGLPAGGTRGSINEPVIGFTGDWEGKA